MIWKSQIWWPKEEGSQHDLKGLHQAACIYKVELREIANLKYPGDI